jgi:hypothetical protein
MNKSNGKKKGAIRRVFKNALAYMFASRILPSTVTVPPMMRYNPILYAVTEGLIEKNISFKR